MYRSITGIAQCYRGTGVLQFIVGQEYFSGTEVVQRYSNSTNM
jgi:hypothetical protein